MNSTANLYFIAAFCSLFRRHWPLPYHILQECSNVEYQGELEKLEKLEKKLGKSVRSHSSISYYCKETAISAFTPFSVDGYAFSQNERGELERIRKFSTNKGMEV